MLDAALERADAHARQEREPAPARHEESPGPTTDRPPIPPGWLPAAPGTKANTVPASSAFPVPSQAVTPEPDAAPERPDAEPLLPAPIPVVATDPAKVWGKAIDQLRQVARQSADRTSDASASEGWKERAQVVEWLATETGKPANLALLTSAVAAIADAARSPAQDVTTRSAQIRSAVLALEERAPLAITQTRLCRNVLGFGAFEPLDRAAVKTGSPVILYAEITGMRYETKGDRYISRLFSRVELISTEDNNKVWEQSLGEAEDQCRNRRRDYCVSYRIYLPPSVAPGEYRLRLNQTDLIARQTASAELRVTVGE
jgi:hypothetical protein